MQTKTNCTAFALEGAAFFFFGSNHTRFECQPTNVVEQLKSYREGSEKNEIRLRQGAKRKREIGTARGNGSECGGHGGPADVGNAVNEKLGNYHN